MFQWLLNNSLRQRLLVLLASLVLLAYGVHTLQHLPVDVFPDLDRPTVTLMSEAGGMAAEEVEELISRPLEMSMSGLPGISSVRSPSSAGLSFVYLSFDWDSDIFRARQMVAERLAAMEEGLPAGVVPRLGAISSIMGEIMQIAIPFQADAADAADGAPSAAMRVREYADWVLRPRLLAIPGVAQVIPIGGEVRQFQVAPDSQRMAAQGVGHDTLLRALRGYAANTSGGFLEYAGREYLIRHLGNSARLVDLQNLALGVRQGEPLLLRQVAEVSFAAALRRGDAGFNGQPAVIVGVHKQPGADTLALTRQIEGALAELTQGLPAGAAQPRLTFRQASFIEASVGTLKEKLAGAALCVAATLLLFLGTLRPTLIALTAIPMSILSSVLVFRYFGMSINTMTLGGLAIAIGGLVDDAVVGVENVLRRLKEDRAKHPQHRLHPLELVARATMEVRSAILYATLIIVLVFLPLFALPGMEGRLFVPLGVAFIVSTLASLLVSVTLTPLLAFYLLPPLAARAAGDTPLLAGLKKLYRRSLLPVLARPRLALSVGLLAVLLALAAAPLLPRTFLPPFNEGTLLIGLRLNPGVTLAESARLASRAETLLADVPEISHVGRRSGRAELDEHAEGVHVSELDVSLLPAERLERSPEAIKADIRRRLAVLPAAVSIGQPISHRIDHMLSGVRSQMALKIFGDDLDTLRAEAERLRARLAGIAGIADLEVEKQVLAPQIKVRLDYAAAARYGVAVPAVLASLEGLVAGENLAWINEGGRRFALLLRLPEAARTSEGLGRLLIDTPLGSVPLSRIASIEESDGPNQISRDDGRRRIVIAANVEGRAISDVVAEVRQLLAATPLPEGYFFTLGGQFTAQEESARLVGALAGLSLTLIFLVLYSRYRSSILALIIMANIPLALVGAVIGLAVARQPLSLAALIGGITLAGISVRNGILKVSHYINLMRSEGESFAPALIVRGSLERLSPVLMTALVTALALAPLLFEASRPGAEILHPVAVVIFSGLISATLLDTYLTPAMFWLFGQKSAERLVNEKASGAF